MQIPSMFGFGTGSRPVAMMGGGIPTFALSQIPFAIHFNWLFGVFYFIFFISGTDCGPFFRKAVSLMISLGWMTW
jgi:hypothetical protein